MPKPVTRHPGKPETYTLTTSGWGIWLMQARQEIIDRVRQCESADTLRAVIAALDAEEQR